MISVGEGASNFEVDQALADDATTALRRWEHLVKEVPRLARRSDRAESLRHLAAWYAQALAESSFIAGPPSDGLDALIDELMGVPPSNSFTTLAAARWAVLVCEELVRLRALISPPAPPAAVGVAVARLELALTTARRQLDERIALISAEDSACAPARAPRAPAQRHGRRLANSTANERSHPDATTSPGGPKTAMRGIGDLPPLPASIPQAATEVAQRREDHRDCGSREVTMTYTVDWESGNRDESLTSRNSALIELFPGSSKRLDLAAAYAFPDMDVPWVRANFVSSVDGAATLGGRSGGLGNDTDRRIFALLRALADVVLVGAGTARAERYGPAEIAPEWQALRAGRTPTPPIAVVSHRLDLDLSSPLFTAAPPHAPTIVITDSTAPEQRRRAAAEVAEVIIAGERQVEPAAAIDALAQRGYRRISCEGGPRLLADLVAAGMLDELCLTHSPMLLAGDAPRIVNGFALPVPLDLRIERLLADGSYLFSRYALGDRASDTTPVSNTSGATR